MSNPLYAALAARLSAEVVEGSEVAEEKRLRFMIRIAPGPPTTMWLGVVKHLLRVSASQGAAWTAAKLDISRHYFIDPNGELRFGWRIIIQAADGPSRYLAQIAQEVKNAQVRAAQIEEVRLNGSPNRRVGALMGQAKVGPQALRNS